MKTLLIIAGVLALAATSAVGQTYVSGDITTSTVWYSYAGPYIVQSDVDILNDSTLTIMPGVVVAFDGNYTLAAMWGSAIIADGNPTNPILFTSNAGAPAPNDWKWMEVSGPNPSSFEYCTFEYAEIGLMVNVSDATISYCTFRNCISSGLFIASASPTVEYCDMYGNRDGIGLSGNAAPSNPTINYCNIHDNTHWNLYTFGFDPPAVTIDAEDNWWGTNVESEIAQEIYDSVDNPDIYVTIDFDPWWSEQPVELSSWTRIKTLFN